MKTTSDPTSLAPTDRHNRPIRLFLQGAACLPDWSFPLLLLALAGLAYGLLFPYLGFYWDEWPITWIAHKLGPDGLARYFATNRPYWGLIYRLTTPILGDTPWHWQLFGLFWRWLSAVALWGALRQIWPRRRDPAAWAALLFLLYPGFGQQSIAMMYGHFFVVFSAYLLSLWASLAAARLWSRRRGLAAALTGLALLLALANLLAMEYFFLLELVRPVLLYWAVPGEEPGRGAWLRALRHALPYLLLFLAAALWRAFFFPYQTQNYQPGLLTDLRAAPLAALLELARTVAADLVQVTLGAWGRALALPDVAALGRRTALVWAGIVLAAAGLSAAGLLLARRSQENGAPRAWAPAALASGLIAMLLAGVPFWLTRLPVTLDYPNDRFTLPFTLGFSLFFAGLLGLLPGRRAWKVVALAAALGLAAGVQFQHASAFRRDWNQHRALFWQLSWRAPGLEPGTTLISTDLPLKYYSDNSLAGPLNWVYAPDNHSQQMSYMFYYASVRTGGRLQLAPGQPIHQDYLAAEFNGSSDRLLALVFQPPACLRVLDPDLDPLNTMLPELMRQAAALSDPALALPAGAARQGLSPQIFGAEPAHAWCYYFEQAALAAQQQDWAAVVELGEQAFATGDYPNDPMERVPFIEGYAHRGDLPRAQALTREAAAITPLMQPVLCRLWERIGAEGSPAGVSEMRQELGCQ